MLGCGRSVAIGGHERGWQFFYVFLGPSSALQELFCPLGGMGIFRLLRLAPKVPGASESG